MNSNKTEFVDDAGRDPSLDEVIPSPPAGVEQRAKEYADSLYKNPLFRKIELYKDCIADYTAGFIAGSESQGQDWISVKDDKPDTRTVIVLTEFGVVTNGWYAGSIGDDSWKGDFIGNITHWRPLPPPPASPE